MRRSRRRNKRRSKQRLGRFSLSGQARRLLSRCIGAGRTRRQGVVMNACLYCAEADSGGGGEVPLLWQPDDGSRAEFSIAMHARGSTHDRFCRSIKLDSVRDFRHGC